MEPFPIFDVSLIHAEAMSSTSSELNEKLLVNDHWNLKKRKKNRSQIASSIFGASKMMRHDHTHRLLIIPIMALAPKLLC